MPSSVTGTVAGTVTGTATGATIGAATSEVHVDSSVIDSGVIDFDPGLRPLKAASISGNAAALGNVHVRQTPWRTGGLLAAGDWLAVTLSLSLGVWLRAWWGDGQDGYDPSFYYAYWPIGLLFVGVFALGGLYPGVPYSPPKELSRIVKSTTCGFLCLGTATFLSKNADAYSRLLLLMAWPVAMALVVFARAAIRSSFCRRPWWGYQAAIIGKGPAARRVIKKMQACPELGIQPAVVVGEITSGAKEIDGVPVVGNISGIRRLAKQYRVPYAIVPTQDLKPGQSEAVVRRFSRLFHHVVLVPKTYGLASLGVESVDLGGMLGLESRYRLLDPKLQILKRTIDLLVVIACMPIWLPVVSVIGLLIKLDSKGPVIFRQGRPGVGGKPFDIFKFRTMHVGAEDELECYLAADSGKRQEWSSTGKLEKDPRVTRVGRWLRCTSLDELPQLFNVLLGQMSLVGPRPILYTQMKDYSRGWALYIRVRPGLTGAWQVSGRNRLTIDERIELDTYYVRNWSIWLDVYLLMVTFKAVLGSKGAY